MRSHGELLRSSPKLYGEGTYVGYEDFGPGLPRGRVYLVLKATDLNFSSVGELLRSVDPRKRAFWLEARMLSGSLEADGKFEALVPEKSSILGRFTSVQRPRLIISGAVLRRADSHYLVMVQDDDSFGGEEERVRLLLAERRADFLEAIEWKDG